MADVSLLMKQRTSERGLLKEARKHVTAAEGSRLAWPWGCGLGF
jgi:hypothetical protein